MSLIISLKSELLKIKRSAVLYVCLTAAAIVPVILFIDVLTPNDGATQLPEAMSLQKYFRMAQQVFNFIFLPLFVILISTMMIQIEYRNNAWKQVLTSPQKFSDIFLSKYLMLQLIIIVFITSFLFLLMAGAFVIDKAHPRLFDHDTGLQPVILMQGKSYLTVMGLSALQFWLALRFKNFLPSVAIGFCLWIIVPLGIAFTWPFINYHPYVFPVFMVEMSDAAHLKPDIPLSLILSIVYAILFLSLGFIDFKHRKIRH